jgi:hypothetical protein
MEVMQPQFFTNDGLRHAWYQWGEASDQPQHGLDPSDSQVRHSIEPPVILQHGFAADTLSNWVTPGVVDDLRQAGRWVDSMHLVMANRTNPTTLPSTVVTSWRQTYVHLLLNLSPGIR